MMLRCWVYSISEGRVINPNYVVNTDNLPIQGLDPDVKVYGEYFTNSSLPYDSRTQTEVLTETMVDDPHPVYGTNLLTYQRTYSYDIKQQAELFLSVDNAEENANNQLPALASKRQRYMKILHKKVKEITLTQEEEDFLDLNDQVADAMEQNADNAEQIKEFIVANPTQIPDLDSGWTTSIE